MLSYCHLETADMKFQSKLPKLEVTIFSVMTQLANEHGAINLSQGFPDFDTHPDLISLVEKYMRGGHNQYAPMQGVMPLRDRIAEKVSVCTHAGCHASAGPNRRKSLRYV
jgi:methionine aminotransferase